MIKFVAGSNKGGVKQGDVFNDPFKLGAMTEERVNYTGRLVVEPLTAGQEKVLWTPVVPESFKAYNAAGVEVEGVTVVADGTIDFAGHQDVVKVRYEYNNEIIPQADLPILNAQMEGIYLEAKPRRIAIYYSAMAAFQAKQEMGMDLGEILATQACAELNYEIDTEVIKMLDDNAGAAVAATTFSKALPHGVSKAEHYEGFAEIIERASQIIYDRTQKHACNYMVVASDVKPILALMRGWKASTAGKINGPYLAGTINGVKVFVSPAIKPGRFICGFNGEDLMTSAAVFAPYIAITPTQLLGFADASMSQGFWSYYDLKMLNPALLVAGAIVE